MSIWFDPFCKVFFSVDLENSLRLKAKGTNLSSTYDDAGASSWFHHILRFYYAFNYLFESKIVSKRQSLTKLNLEDSMSLIPSPNIWKAVGDEILFESDIKNEFELFHLVNCFREVLQEFNKVEHAIDGTSDLGGNLMVKGTVWIASFPIINEVLYVRSNFQEITKKGLAEDHWILDQLKLSQEDGKARVDYIGPSIDVGFRLKSFATNRKLILAPALTLAISSAMYDLSNEDIETEKATLPLYFEGMKSIRGLLTVDLEPPVFWTDSGSHDRNYYQVLNKVEHRKPVPTSTVVEYLNSYFQKQDLLFSPFIPGSRKFGRAPNGYQKLLEKQRLRYSREIERVQRQQQAKNMKEVEPKKSPIEDFQVINKEASKKIDDLLRRLEPQLGKKEPNGAKHAR